MNRIKMPKRILRGIIGVLVVWLLVGAGIVSAVVSTPIVEEPLGENFTQAIVGDEVVGLRTETSKTYYLGGSTYRLISTGPLHYEDGQGDWQQIDNAIVGGQMLKDAYHLSILQEDFDEGQVLEWSVEGEYVRFQPMSLGWTNDYDQIQQISMPQAVTASVVNTPMPLLEEGDGYSQGKVVWDDAYGAGRDFQWTSTPHKLEKLLTLDAAPPAPAQYIIDGGNPVLRLSFIFAPSADLDIYIDGALWDKNTKVTTFSAIEFKKDGETLWVFNPVSCWDATGETQIGKTTLRRVGSDLWVDVLVPYEWLQTASYPVFIDPTLTVQPDASGEDSYISQFLSTTNMGDGLGVQAGHSEFLGTSLATRAIIEFPVDWGVDIPDGATISSAVLSLSVYGRVGTDTYYASRMLRLNWVEGQVTWVIYKTGSSWSTAGCGSNGNDYTTTDQVGITISSTGWKSWTITNQVITAQSSDINVGLRISGVKATAANDYFSAHSSDYTDDTSLRPKLVIDYTVVAPEAECEAASNIGATTARLNGIITDDKGHDCEARFRYAEGQSDNFEWGIDEAPLDDSDGGIDWTITVAGDSKAEIDTAQHYGGTRSARLHRDATNNAQAYFSQTAVTATQDIDVAFRKDANSDLILVHGDGSWRIVVRVHNNENIYWYDGVGYQNTNEVVLINTWYLLSVRNVNWTAHTFDIYLDGDIIKSGADMHNYPSQVNEVSLINIGANSDVWIDNVLVHEDWTVTEWQNSLNTDSTYYEDIASLDIVTDYVFQTQPREIVGDTEGDWSASAYFETGAAGYSFGVVIG